MLKKNTMPPRTLDSGTAECLASTGITPPRAKRVGRKPFARSCARSWLRRLPLAEAATRDCPGLADLSPARAVKKFPRAAAIAVRIAADAMRSCVRKLDRAALTVSFLTSVCRRVLPLGRSRRAARCTATRASRDRLPSLRMFVPRASAQIFTANAEKNQHRRVTNPRFVSIPGKRTGYLSLSAFSQKINHTFSTECTSSTGAQSCSQLAEADDPAVLARLEAVSRTRASLLLLICEKATDDPTLVEHPRASPILPRASPPPPPPAATPPSAPDPPARTRSPPAASPRRARRRPTRP